MRQGLIRLRPFLLAIAVAGIDPTTARGQELPQPLSAQAWDVAAPGDLRLSADTSAARGNWLAGGLAGALAGGFVGLSVADGMDVYDMNELYGLMIGEAIGLPLGVHFSTTPRARASSTLLASLVSTAIMGIAFVATAETRQPAFLVVAVPLQFMASVHLMR